MLRQERTGVAGDLQSIDGYMNIALEKCGEHVNGVKKGSYGDAFIRRIRYVLRVPQAQGRGPRNGERERECRQHQGEDMKGREEG